MPDIGADARRPPPTWLSWLDDTQRAGGISVGRRDGSADFIAYRRIAELGRTWRRPDRSEPAERPDAVIIIGVPSAALFASFFGLLARGIDVCLVAPPGAFTGDDTFGRHCRVAVDAVGPRLVLCDADHVEQVTMAMAGRNVPVEVLAEPLAGRSPTTTPLVHTDRPGDLLQLTSGSSGAARCVEVSAAAVDHNVTAIAEWLQLGPADATASWLPLYHDMGLIGCFLTPVARGIDLHLLTPAQFVRNPLRYLSLFDAGYATVSAMPPFGLELVMRRVGADDLAGFDLASWRSLIVGAERVPFELLCDFGALLAPHGFRAEALCPAYGLAEATLAVTGSRLDEEPRAAASPAGGMTPYVSCGRPLPGIDVRVVDDRGEPLTDRVGEIVVSAPSLARGYRGTPGRSTHFRDGELWTGDAGFVRDHELHVVGRMGDAVKVRATWLFAEDLEAEIDHPAFRHGRAAVLVGQTDDRVRVVVVADRRVELDLTGMLRHLRAQAVDAEVTTLEVARSEILRTSSGKPRRSDMWTRFVTVRSASGEPSNSGGRD